MADAPNLVGNEHKSSYRVNWTAYGSRSIPPDSRFIVSDYKATTITSPDGLDNLRTIITSGMPIIYGTYLYPDFPHYRGTPTPYIGNGRWLHKNGKKVGHGVYVPDSS